MAADAVAVKNWRKQAMAGQAHVDGDARMYFATKERLLNRSESLDFIVDKALEGLRGFLPPGLQS